ncbi:efflux RND transporter periplasmic adaptor subunit [Agrobacterium vitis]|uniref:Efflux RND transporter periplasmic adaptor subunit n=1 Tax=Agrobacterium vitis TaxID=373 RepID=A0A6A9UKJ1_AGRVI|nr:efflux RND transporter periplasmic adaptor subunit [Agrobacterium vitis]MCE6074630.1 efflux RND transporter periplasmic adaptor subunit [Agrobacterium vitis]MCF1451295.1 efflux RND transporter periplasmic adaptor subunit [Agrobacterium vitis]MCF1467199.1 efflux RND transporter periplasmic adaptor subunit [Agrobacterium vitis]MCM2451811.1 efflux RND transporter periplasmic adaptor subunit [Agrobacterium vitis]MCM2470096.1 efflux RND transporter periplasmic adaptor subunit [Agrobacterium viti
MRLQTTLSGLACVLLALCLAGCNEKTESQSSPRSVTVTKAQTAQYQPSVEISGSVKARVQSDLSFRTAGRVIERHVDVGDRVKAGDVLALLDNTEQKADIAVAQAGLESAEATMRQKTLAFDRYKVLIQTNTIAQSTFDQAREDLATAQGSLQTAQANLATAQDAMTYTQLKADADGIITSRSIEVGQVVSAAQAALTLAHDGPRDAVFDMFEAFFLEGAPSDTVEVSPIGDRAHAKDGKIREVSPAIDTSAGTIRIKVALPADTQWSLGTTVVGRFRAQPQQGIVLPWSAMASANGQPAVWAVNAADSSVKLRKIDIARYRVGDFVVASGVAPGDIIVTDGGKFLTDGQVVAFKEK